MKRFAFALALFAAPFALTGCNDVAEVETPAGEVEVEENPVTGELSTDVDD